MEAFKNDEWYTLTHSDTVIYENPHFTNVGYFSVLGKNIQQSFSIETLVIILVPGKYRLVKIFLTPVAPYYRVILTVPFTVTSKHGLA
ncbi:immunoglobulin-like domain-containing protein [Sporosarcina sp. P19]|uniref:immunoglobulin-like domain-containing protein n=1 Tax=Sporosarcina sp. P19 TaxID=2048258 RepID=UPI00351705A4